MKIAMEPLKKLMSQTDKVHIVAPGTDLSFSIKGIPAEKYYGTFNIPDGEVATCPVKNSVNGYITYNTKTKYNDIIFEDIKFDFINGKMAGQTASIMSRNYFKLHMFNTDINVGEYKAGDRVKLFLMLSHGKIRCIQKKWSSYRYVLVGGDSYCSTHKCKYDEFVPYYKGIYEYSCDEDISNKIKQVSEYMYLWELFKSYMKGKNIYYKNEMLRIAKLSNNKMGIFLFFLYTCRF